MNKKTLEIRTAYLDWIAVQKIPDTNFYERSEDRFRFDSDFAKGELNFYDLEMYVAELRITDTKTDETAFFLHFELNDLDYAKSLFNEFLDAYELIRSRKHVRVLLSCTSAITTSFMAGKLNEAAKLLSLDYHFDATPYPTLMEKVYDYDMVLLAPQIAQESDALKSTLPDTPILNIKPRLFATYDAPAILDTVRREWGRHIEKSHKKATLHKSLDDIKNDANILTLVLLPHARFKFTVQYRFYKNGLVVFDETVVKTQFNMVKDICDILDTATYRFDHFDIIGLSIGGIINDGHIDLVDRIEEDLDFKAYLEERYKVPVILKNNTNTAAYGYYARHTHYDNIAFVSMPFRFRFAGAGFVINKRPYEGSHHIAGELKFTVMNEYNEKDNRNFSLLPGETISTLEMFIKYVIAINDPDIILIRCRILPDVEVIRMQLLSYIPEKYLPKIKIVSDEDSTEYMLLGMMLFCVDEIGEI